MIQDTLAKCGTATRSQQSLLNYKASCMRALSTFVREIFFVLTLFGMISLEHVKILFFFFFFKLSFKKCGEVT